MECTSLMPIESHMSTNSFALKVPVSVTNLCGQLNLVKMFSVKNFMTT